MAIAQINIYRDEMFQSSVSYSWGVRDFDAYPDESAGAPQGSGKTTITAALVDAVNAAIANECDGARVTYYNAARQSRSLDCHFAGGAFGWDRAKAMADTLMAA